MAERFLPIKASKEVFDRFIPNRSAMDFDYAHFALTEGLRQGKGEGLRQGKEASSSSKVTSPPKEAYRKALAETLNMNRTRILAFRRKPQAPPQLFPTNYHHSVPLKPRRPHIPKVPDRTLDTPGLVDNFYFNLLDWGSRNVLAIALGDTVYIRDASTGSTDELVTIDEENGPITSISWAPDGCHVAVGLNNSEVQLWNSASARRVRTLKSNVHQSGVGSLAWNNHILTTGRMDGKIVNNDVRIRSHAVGTYRGHTQEICGLKWSDSGNHLASGGNDNAVHIWDRSVASSNSAARWLHRLQEHTSAVRALAWCPFQSSLFATGGAGDDGTIKFWNSHTGACLNSVDTGSQICLCYGARKRESCLARMAFRRISLRSGSTLQW